MHNVTLAFEALWKVLLIGLLLGAGLPTLFAAGIRFQAWGQGGEAEVHSAGTAVAAPHAVGRALAGLCFLLVLAGIAVGILFVVVTGMGNTLDFGHVYPTIDTK